MNFHVQMSWQVQHFANLHVQISWQVQHFMNLHMQISWRAQHFVHLHVQISWQAQHKMRCGEIANARNAVFFSMERWLRSWQVKVCGTTVATRSRVMVGIIHVQISWQAQHFVHLHVQISWQAQHKMRCGEIANARNAVFFNGNGGSEAGKSRSAERRLRDGLGSWSESSVHWD